MKSQIFKKQERIENTQMNKVFVLMRFRPVNKLVEKKIIFFVCFYLFYLIYFL
jgi:hypothetical protein